MEGPQAHAQGASSASENSTPVTSLSDYAQSLTSEDQNRYFKKLKYNDGTSNLPDPFGLDDGWSDRMWDWPDILFGDIFMYLIDYPDRFTPQSLKNHRSLEAYRSFLRGDVQVVFSHEVSDASPYSLMKAKVKSSGQTHQLWVAVEKEYSIIHSAHCKCMTTTWDVCDHIVAVLFMVEVAALAELTKSSSVTKICENNEEFRRARHPPTIAEMFGGSKERKTKPSGPPDPSLLRLLYAVAPNAVLFEYIDKKTFLDD